MIKLETILNAAIRKDSFCIPREMVINGSFRSETSGQLAGSVYGDVLVKGKIVILKEGCINGDISADEITVYGRIRGDVRYCTKMIIHSGAVVNGNIAALEIHTEKDAIVEGLICKPGTTENKKKSLPPNPDPVISDINNTQPFDQSATIKLESWF